MAVRDAPIEVAVIGVGRMGSHHARIYRTLPQAKLVAVVDADAARAASAGKLYQCDACTDVAMLLERHPNLGAATVATPTFHHQRAAQPLLERGVACLVEKPLAADRRTSDALARCAAEHGAVLQVGHTERFNPALRALTAMRLQPCYIEAQRISPMTFRSLDVGVVMDMMIHDIDIVLMLVGQRPTGVEAVGLAVLGEYEDMASARLTFPGGCIANLSASRLALRVERRMRLYSRDAYVNVDYQQRTGSVIRRAAHDRDLADLRRRIAAGEDLTTLNYRDMVHAEPLAMDLPPGEQDPLTAELSQFLAAAAGGARPAVDGEAGAAAVDVALQIVESLRRHTWQAGDPAATP